MVLDMLMQRRLRKQIPPNHWCHLQKYSRRSRLSCLCSFFPLPECSKK